MADAPLVVVAALWLMLLAALIAAGSWSHRRERERDRERQDAMREREHARQDAMIEQRVTEAVAALPAHVRQQSVQGVTLLDRIIQNLVAASTRDPNGDPEA